MKPHELFPPLIGIQLKDAFLIFKRFGVQYRISEMDGKKFDLSLDVRQNRCNIKVNEHVVIDYAFY